MVSMFVLALPIPWMALVVESECKGENSGISRKLVPLMSNIEVIQELYRAFREKDYDAFLSMSTEDLEWVQNEGFPGGATRRGASEVIEKVFKANNNNWKDFAYQIEEVLDAGNSVVVIGRYTGHNRISGKSMSAAAAHVYDFRDGKVCRFRMFADTKTIWDSMT